MQKFIFFVSITNKKKLNRQKRYSQRQNRKSVKRKTARKASCKYRLTRFEKYQLVTRLALTVNRHFPDFYRQISKLPDYRKRPQYEVHELIISGLLMFLFKQKSRNKADSNAKNLDYQDNIKHIFGVKVADMDTVDKYLRWIEPAELETIKQDMFRELVKSKTFQKYKFNGKYFILAIDGSGLQSFDYEPYPACPYKKHKNGKKIWTTYVLEAKIVTSNGFSLSLATEWIENPTDQQFNKQDCEFEAFKRLSAKLKKSFPRLSLLILLDGLYPKKPIFEICKNNNWIYIITLKDKTLKTVQEQISDKLLFKDYQQKQHIKANRTHWIENNYKIFEKLDYKGYTLYATETLVNEKHKETKEEKHTRFVHISDIKTDVDNVHKISKTGRLRWKIENEGFNNQKKNGYNLCHKFSRTNFNAIKNYYQILQIADIINQLTYKLVRLNNLIIKYGLTINSVIEDILSYLKALNFTDNQLIKEIFKKNEQFRY